MRTDPQRFAGGRTRLIDHGELLHPGARSCATYTQRQRKGWIGSPRDHLAQHLLRWVPATCSELSRSALMDKKRPRARSASRIAQCSLPRALHACTTFALQMGTGTVAEKRSARPLVRSALIQMAALMHMAAPDALGCMRAWVGCFPLDQDA
jgi:hypothetical protein